MSTSVAAWTGSRAKVYTKALSVGRHLCRARQRVLVEACGALWLHERLRFDRLGEQHVAAGLQSFRDLEHQAGFVALADILADFVGLRLADTQCLERAPAEQQTGFQRLAQFIIDIEIAQR